MTVRQTITVGIVLGITGALIAWGFDLLREARNPLTLFSTDIAVKCPQNGGQKCSETWAKDIDLTHQGNLEISYRVGDLHCGPGHFSFYLDGEFVGDTGILGWNGNPLGLPLYGTIVTGIVNEGRHRLVLQGYGEVGGCNKGEITSHEGVVTVTLQR